MAISQEYPFWTSIYRAVSLEPLSCRTWEVKHFCYQTVDRISESHHHKDKKMGSLIFSTMNTLVINYTSPPCSPSEKCVWFSSSSLSSVSSMIMKKCGKNDKICISAFWKNCLQKTKLTRHQVLSTFNCRNWYIKEQYLPNFPVLPNYEGWLEERRQNLSVFVQRLWQNLLNMAPKVSYSSRQGDSICFVDYTGLQ